MTEQLSLFEAFGVEIFDARIHEEAVKEAKRESMKNAAAAKEVKVETPKVDPKEEIKQIIDRTLAPTWRVEIFDKNKAQRFAWYRCEHEEEAKESAKKEYEGLIAIREIRESEYTIEQIEEMD
ncbi:MULTISPECIES: hypothetical protein [Bacillales]|nr:hypothetical protein [Bacillus cereus]PED33891.1 hypothetical protein CON13_01575 [Bacillus cereus]PEE52088.1 hypothetical protein COM80_16735 [Bacillus cereus]PFL90934.1 hypothetical protein COJ35_24410 [Bacillus cereus]PFV69435.1 hypothetical protein COL16_18315 [Bacillus cereus]PGS34961.1 hypothetical protein COC56_16600 [Bacillus cereus]